MKRQISKKAVLQAAAGYFLSGFGGGLYVLCALGSDCFNAVGIAISKLSGLPTGTISFLMQTALLIVAFFLARDQIGIGTILGIAEIALVMNVMERSLAGVFAVLPFFVRLALLLIIPAIVALSVALEQASGLGITINEIVSIAIAKRVKALPFGAVRILYDCTYLGISLLLGGKLGIGNLTSALFTGPWMQFFMGKIKSPAAAER